MVLTVLQDLQQNVLDVRMCLFDLVKQYHTVGAAAHGLGELAAFVMTQIARRCPQQAGSGVLFLILRHIELEQGLLAAKPAHGKCTGQCCLAYPGGAEEEHGPDGPTRLPAGPRFLH